MKVEGAGGGDWVGGYVLICDKEIVEGVCMGREGQHQLVWSSMILFAGGARKGALSVEVGEVIWCDIQRAE